MKLPSVKKAFALHFAISLVIFLVLVFLMMKIWFPGELFFMDGGWEGLKIIAPIDLVLGPMLTLLFYRPWKKSLKFDMTAIAMVQIIALGYGVYSAYQQRTAAIVFAEHRFETISLSELNAASVQLTDLDIQVKPAIEFGKMPILIYATPYGADNYGKYLEDILNGLPELRERSDRYNKLTNARTELEKYRITQDSTNGTTIEVPASSTSDTVDVSAEVYPLKARYFDGTITFDGENYKIERNGSLFADN